MEADTQLHQVFREDIPRYTGSIRKKDVFVEVYRQLKELDVKTLLDIGCASGDFLYHLDPSIRATGIDIEPELIATARMTRQKDNLRFECGDILSASTCDTHYDVVTLLGTLHTFLDFRTILERIRRLRPKFLFIHSPFNDSPIDTRHFHRDATRGETDFQCGYAIYAKQTIENHLKTWSPREITFFPFEMITILTPDPDSPIYNFHLPLADGTRALTNGIGILMREYILKVRL